MNAHLILRGSCPDDRSERVALRLKRDYPSLTAYTEQIFFLRLATPLTSERQQKISALLSAWHPCPPLPAGEPLVITPRPGTVSPWSSKAGDILANCGFHEVSRVEQGWVHFLSQKNLPLTSTQLLEFYDPMTEVLWRNTTDIASLLFAKHQSSSLTHIDIHLGGLSALQASNRDLSLALSADEMDYLLALFHRLKRNPTDAELMMFAQANSEHCRHKIFNAAWKIDGKMKSTISLFDAIRQTHDKHPASTLVAYDDNAAVLEGCIASAFAPNAQGVYEEASRLTHLAIKVETHNHPTAIAPFPGAATGVGGEIRDELATGRGGKPVAGLCGYVVSNLHLPNDPQPWEKNDVRPPHLASPLEIMIKAPLGAAAYANEIGRCTLAGFFRTYEQRTSAVRWGYFKPIMLAGGVAHIYNEHVKKLPLPVGAALVQLGGPAMLIGLGGGASSSLHSGSNSRELDFASVQRGNAEMERRVLEVILSCLRKGADNPILSIHDVGAGGLSNALPELVHGASRGGVIDMNAIPSADEGLSPLQLWCNEAQERMVLAVAPEKVDALKQICLRERCPMAVVGAVSSEEQLRVQSGETRIVDLALKDLIGALPQKTMHAETFAPHLGTPFDLSKVDVGEALLRVLQLPAVAAKNFLITIGDRTVGGLTARDQMVGPYQRAVADCAVTGMSFAGHHGQAFAVGEKSPLALLHPAASARMAVGEALTNLAAARLSHHGQRIKLSANWMAAAGDPRENHALWLAVTAITDHFCDEVGFSIPVGKDSLSMKASWQEKGKHLEVISPVSLAVSAFALCEDIRDTFTAELAPTTDSVLLLVDLGDGHRLGGSALAQVYGTTGETPPDANGKRLAAFMALMQDFHCEKIILAYHDRSDGGVLTTLCEMAFASHVGLDVFVPTNDVIGFLFNEELGAIVQVREEDRVAVQVRIEKAVGRPAPVISRIHCATPAEIRLSQNGKILRTFPLTQLLRQWMKTSHAIQLLRDNADCAQEEFAELNEPSRLFTRLTFTSTVVRNTHRPRVMILREQGTNGHVELAKAFSLSGFEAVDVHMSDLLQGRNSLTDFQGLAMGGGFSYGDALGAGRGWANTILHHEKLKSQFAEFFARTDTFTIGICNGCQALASLQSLIPGAVEWPAFTRNRSQRFEARLVMVEVVQSPSPLFAGMTGSVLPVVVSHGEGRVEKMPEGVDAVLRYVDGLGHPAINYPQNPNGSYLATAGICSPDGRVTLMMPHPERVFLPWQMSWLPKEWCSEAWQNHTPWLEMFHNIRRWVN